MPDIPSGRPPEEQNELSEKKGKLTELMERLKKLVPERILRILSGDPYPYNVELSEVNLEDLARGERVRVTIEGGTSFEFEVIMPFEDSKDPFAVYARCVDSTAVARVAIIGLEGFFLKKNLEEGEIFPGFVNPKSGDGITPRIRIQKGGIMVFPPEKKGEGG